MVRHSFFYFLGLYLFSIQIFAQKQVESLEKLSEQINTEAEEILPLLSPSGDSLFFARVFHELNKGGKYSGSDIWLSIYDNESQTWAIPTNDLRNWNDKRNNFIIGINPNEKIIYQNNPKDPEKGIRFVKNINNNWTKPENLSLPGIPKSGYQGMYVSPDYSVILISMKSSNNYGKEDLYVSTKNNQGNWTAPVNLGTTINTSESEISPFLTADKKTLFFASKGHGGYGDMDIFMAERLYNSWTVWSKPQNLGDQINSAAFDGYYSEYGDSIAFFSSNREGELSDVYGVRFGKNLDPSIRENFLVYNEKNILDKNEVLNIFGFQIDSLIYFEENTDNIKSNSSELLFFIANNLKKKYDISILLIGNGSSALTNTRQKKASIYLQNNGISPNRIETEIKSNLSNSIDDKILLYFYRNKE
ncbi:hypothetical protein [Marivirga sp.]|uniref:hypothetical protein n=1 Tax=Marivirga sp. TaxID=2018662 RepID=UPI003DA7186B